MNKYINKNSKSVTKKYIKHSNLQLKQVLGHQYTNAGLWSGCVQKPASFHPWQSEEVERSLQLPNSKRKHVYENLSEAVAVISHTWNKLCMFWCLLCVTVPHTEQVLHVLVSYGVTVLSMLQLLNIYPRRQTVTGIRPYIWGIRYVPPYRLWFWGSRSLNRLTFFDLVSVVYPVWSLDRVPLLWQLKFTKCVNAQLEEKQIIC